MKALGMRDRELRHYERTKGDIVRFLHTCKVGGMNYSKQAETFPSEGNVL